MSSVHPTTLKTYSQRSNLHSNPTAKRLLEIMHKKETNLCVSVDVTKSEEVLDIVKRVGRDVCMVKTHCDIIEDFSQEFIDSLVKLSEELDFIIFEDRKFADIGNTVSLQYSSGTHRISSWSHLTNAHPLPGPGIISGLAQVGKPLGRGLLLLAEMSSKGNLATGGYTQECVRMARSEESKGWVVGFIAMSRAALQPQGGGEEEQEGEDFIICTPGVGLAASGDKLGQQYRTPRQVVLESGCDVIIVGRGIYGDLGKGRVEEEAGRYRQDGWAAYLERIGRK